MRAAVQEKGQPTGESRDPEGALWSVPDVVRYLRVSERWVRQQVSLGNLPAMKIARNLRFDPDDVRNFALTFRL